MSCPRSLQQCVAACVASYARSRRRLVRPSIMAGTEARAGSLDGSAHIHGLMAAQDVHGNDVSGLQDLRRLLLGTGGEARAVDRAAEYERDGSTIATQGSREGHGAPMAMLGKALESLHLGPEPRRGHVSRLDPGFVAGSRAFGIQAATRPRSPVFGSVDAAAVLAPKGEQRCLIPGTCVSGFAPPHPERDLALLSSQFTVSRCGSGPVPDRSARR